jgi:hypothetical protein
MENAQPPRAVASKRHDGYIVQTQARGENNMSIKVDTNVPYGNAGGVSVVSHKGRSVVYFTPDPHGGPECLWFCFRIRRSGGSGKVRLVMCNVQNILGCSPATNLRPVFRRGGGDWQRLQPGTPEELTDGRANVWWDVDMGRAASADAAICYPYGRPELEALVAETRGYWRAETIGLSQQGRPIIRLANTHGERGGSKPGIYLVARQHSGETPGGWTLDGMLRHFAAARADDIVVWAVPLTNIDGVEQGDYGKDNFPYDLNRAWGQPPMRHEVLVMQRDMRRWADRCRPALGLDLHAPGGCEGGGIYAHISYGLSQMAQVRAASVWSEALAQALERKYASPNFSRTTEWGERWHSPTFSAFCWNTMGFPALCIEVPYALCGETLMTREEYREAGRRMAACLIERLRR